MGENRKELEQQTDPQKQPQAPPSNPTPEPASTLKNHGDTEQPVSVSGGEKTVDLAELKENERRFHTIFETAPIGIVMADPEGHFLKVNDRFARMLGYRPDEFSQLSVLDVTYPEAWLRVRNASGDPIGAIAVYASSVDLDYASTHAAQYEMVDLLVSDQMRTIGGLMYNGACYAIDLYSDRGEKTFESYHIFGDVSLQVRTDTPEAMTVSHASVIDSGATTFEVTVTGVEDALCALSRNAELLGYAYSNATGYALIQLDQPITGAIPLDLVVTAFNIHTAKFLVVEGSRGVT